MAEQVTAPITAPVVAPAQAIPGTPSAPPKAGTELHVDKGDVKPKAPEPRYIEHKVNGKVKRYTEAELLTKAGLVDGAYEKFESASQKEKKQAEWKKSAQKDFMSALMDPELGLTKDQIRTRFEGWYKENYIDPETLTPEQRELSELRKEREENNKKSKEREDEEKTKNELHAQSLVREEMQKQIISCIESSGLPKTRFVAGRMAYWQKQNLSKNYDAPNDVIVQQVREERHSIVRQDIEAMTPDQVVETFGEEIIKKLRQFDLGRLEKRFNQKTNNPVISRERGEDGKKTMADVDNYLNNLRRSKTSRRE